MASIATNVLQLEHMIAQSYFYQNALDTIRHRQGDREESRSKRLQQDIRSRGREAVCIPAQQATMGIHRTPRCGSTLQRSCWKYVLDQTGRRLSMYMLVH